MGMFGYKLYKQTLMVGGEMLNDNIGYVAIAPRIIKKIVDGFQPARTGTYSYNEVLCFAFFATGGGCPFFQSF